jgi:hypothetical protein
MTMVRPRDAGLDGRVAPSRSSRELASSHGLPRREGLFYSSSSAVVALAAGARWAATCDDLGEYLADFAVPAREFGAASDVQRFGSLSE